jgi:hypothetical protein
VGELVFERPAALSAEPSGGSVEIPLGSLQLPPDAAEPPPIPPVRGAGERRDRATVHPAAGGSAQPSTGPAADDLEARKLRARVAELEAEVARLRATASGAEQRAAAAEERMAQHQHAVADARSALHAALRALDGTHPTSGPAGGTRPHGGASPEAPQSRRE